MSAGSAVAAARPPAEEPERRAAPTAARSGGDAAAQAATRWRDEVLPALKPFARAMFNGASVVGARDGSLVLGLPNDAHRRKCADQLRDVEVVLEAVLGERVPVSLVVDGSADDEFGAGDEFAAGGRAHDGAAFASVVELHPGGAPTPDEDIDLDDLVDAPPESVITPIERLAQAFPGSELLDERR